jgi:ubiquinone/menaquinone biosynthesis C-methylase UbiE
MEDLHRPILPILELLVAEAGWPAGGLLLDVGCGAGLKSALLLGRVGRVLGLDIDAGMLRAAPQSNGLLWVAADAAALPLAAGSADGAWCAATLGLLANRAAALAELRRALRPGGVAVIVTAEQRWAALHRWPAPLLAELVAAWSLARAALRADSEPASELAESLRNAGFAAAQGRAFHLEAATPTEAELPLLPWPQLRAALTPFLPTATLAAAATFAAAPDDVELVSLLLAARAIC